MYRHRGAPVFYKTPQDSKTRTPSVTAISSTTSNQTIRVNNSNRHWTRWELYRLATSFPGHQKQAAEPHIMTTNCPTTRIAEHTTMNSDLDLHGGAKSIIKAQHSSHQQEKSPNYLQREVSTTIPCPSPKSQFRIGPTSKLSSSSNIIKNAKASPAIMSKYVDLRIRIASSTCR